MDELSDAGQEPDVMVNLTNDGWFFGTACLDHHLACNIFRAVEMRKPHLVCANTGLSAHIGVYGQLHSVGPRRAPDILQAIISKHTDRSIYRTIGDWLPFLFGWISLIALLSGLWQPKTTKGDSV